MTLVSPTNFSDSASREKGGGQGEEEEEEEGQEEEEEGQEDGEEEIDEEEREGESQEEQALQKRKFKQCKSSGSLSSALKEAKSRTSIRSLLDDVASKPNDRTAKIYMSRLDVKQIRRMAKATKALPSIHRTRKLASAWLVKWASDQRSSRILAANPQCSQPRPLSAAPHFVPQYSDIFKRAPLAPKRRASIVADQVDRINQQQHMQLLTHMFSASLTNAQMQCSVAASKLEQLIAFGHLHSRADLAWMLLDGREGVAKNPKRAFELVEDGARMGCSHCLGVLSACHWGGLGCEMNKALSWQLASASAAGGSRYGFWTLGVMYRLGEGGAPPDYQQALQLFNMAAVLNLDAAQFMLGYAYFYGLGIAGNLSQAMRWFNMGAVQGHPDSCYMVGRCMELADHGAVGRTNAIRWYQRAFAAGHAESAVELFGQICSS